jgi:hypothetical protein
MSYYQEQEFVYEPYEEQEYYEDEEEQEDLDYGEEKEEEVEIEEGLDNENLEEELFDDQLEVIDPNQFTELTFANLPFSMKDLYSKPLTSLQQVKMLYTNKNEKINFADMPDEDLFKLLVNLTCYSNKIQDLLELKNMQLEIDTMLSNVDKIPDLKYKNPLATFLAFICVKKNGAIKNDILKQVFTITETLNLLRSDIYRYARMWQVVYNIKPVCYDK